MFRNLIIMSAVTLASMGSMASAEVISIQPGQFTVLSENLGTDSGIRFQGSYASCALDIDFDAGLTADKDAAVPRIARLSETKPVAVDYSNLSWGLTTMLTPDCGAINIVIASDIVEYLDIDHDAIVVRFDSCDFNIDMDTIRTAQFRAYDDLSADSYGTITSIAGWSDR